MGASNGALAEQTPPDCFSLAAAGGLAAYFARNKETWHGRQLGTRTDLSPGATEGDYLGRQHCHLGDGKTVFQSHFSYHGGGEGGEGGMLLEPWKNK